MMLIAPRRARTPAALRFSTARGNAAMQKSKLMELTYHNMDDARLASQVKLTKELANVEVALIKPMLQDNNPP